MCQYGSSRGRSTSTCLATGPRAAPVVLTVFCDFATPDCGRLSPLHNFVKNLYGDKLRLVYRQFPLVKNPDAYLAAEASLAANAQGARACSSRSSPRFLPMVARWLRHMAPSNWHKSSTRRSRSVERRHRWEWLTAFPLDRRHGRRGQRPTSAAKLLNIASSRLARGW